MDRFSQGKVVTVPTLPAFPGRVLTYMQGAVRYVWRKVVYPSGICLFNFVHPCKVKSFRKAVSAVMDDLVTHSEIIEDLNKIVKLEKLMSARLTSRG